MLVLPHKVTFTENMTATITQFNEEMDYGQFSAGQQARVNFALSFAFRDVLQKRHGKVNICILDEVLDTSLGNVGVSMATKMIKEVAKNDHLSMYVISHKDEIVQSFDKVLELEFRNGFTSVISK